jgi:hypothetical protein
MSSQYYGGRPRRSAAPIVAIIVGTITLLVGAAALAAAAQYKPTLENALSNGGEVLSPDSYNSIHGVGLAFLVMGGVALLGGIVGLASRPAVAVQAPGGVYYGQQPQPWHNPPAAQAWAPPAVGQQQPAPPQQWAPPGAIRSAATAPPPDAAHRVG